MPTFAYRPNGKVRVEGFRGPSHPRPRVSFVPGSGRNALAFVVELVLDVVARQTRRVLARAVAAAVAAEREAHQGDAADEQQADEEGELGV